MLHGTRKNWRKKVKKRQPWLRCLGWKFIATFSFVFCNHLTLSAFAEQYFPVTCLFYVDQLGQLQFLCVLHSSQWVSATGAFNRTASTGLFYRVCLHIYIRRYLLYKHVDFGTCGYQHSSGNQLSKLCLSIFHLTLGDQITHEPPIDFIWFSISWA